MSTLRRVVFSFAVLSLFAPFARAGDWEFPKDWFWHKDDAQRAKHEPMLGKPAPLLDLSDWKNQDMQEGSARGKIVVLDFWATWCGPCIKSIPHNNEMMEKYKDDGVEIIGICTSNRGQEKYEQTVKDKDIKYPVARDKDRKSEQAWQVMWFPTYAVVDRKGNVRAIGLKPEYVEKVIDKLLEESPGTKKKAK